MFTNDSSGLSPGNPKNQGGEKPILIDGIFYIPSTALLTGIEKIALKDNELFVVLDTSGAAPRIYGRELGFYWQDTRYLDTWEFSLNGEPPTTLSSNRANHLSAHLFFMTNRDMPCLTEVGRISRDMLHIFRSIHLVEDRVIEKLTFVNFDMKPHRIHIERKAGSAFHDIFEVRGMNRPVRGTIQNPTFDTDHQTIALSYLGLDGYQYTTSIWTSEPPTGKDLEDLGILISHQTNLQPRIPFLLTYVLTFGRTMPKASPKINHDALSFVTSTQGNDVGHPTKRSRLSPPQITCDNPALSKAFSNAMADLDTLITRRGSSIYPDAGIPWFCAPFGRDGIISAYQLLPWCPDLAAGVLEVIFSSLGSKIDADTDEEPGKVFHEQRFGEMARQAEVPFRPYFGSVDATPLALILFGEYAAWTRKIDFVYRWWDAACRSLEWICARLRRREGSPRIHGFVTYQAAKPTGLRNQGWKDSHDALMYSDGTFPEPPIALCEVQAYAFAALTWMAKLASLMGKENESEIWRKEALGIKQKFCAQFWDDTQGSIVLAIDSKGRPLRVNTSNMGHCLWSEILHPHQGAMIAKLLLQEELFSGHGVRTLGTREPTYNPLSYHNGSIWPHDNSLIIDGLRRYGAREQMIKLAEAMFHVILTSDDYRLPELYCGFEKIDDEKPVPYEVACKPQAWAAGSIFLILKSLLGMESRLGEENLIFRTPILPKQIKTLEVRGLPIHDFHIDFVVRQGAITSTVELLASSGPSGSVIQVT